MSRQHTPPVIIGTDGARHVLRPVGLGGDDDFRVSEAEIQRLVELHPECLPIREIDPIFNGAISICTELNTQAGAIDNFLITPSGLPLLVECKLWRNPESRREVVGQIIDYAKELSRWTISDLQREVSKRIENEDSLISRVRRHFPQVDEIAFNDAVTLNLRLGRFLLLIVGDGIREGVEAITEYVQRHSGLHFTLGLIELPMFICPDGARLVAPRVVARTSLITRTVVAVPEHYQVLAEDAAAGADVEIDPMTLDRIAFWKSYLEALSLDDPDQPRPRAADTGWLSFTMPAPSGSCWLTVWRNVSRQRVGVYLSYSRASVGQRSVLRVLEDLETFRSEFSVQPTVEVGKDERHLLSVTLQSGSLADPAERARAISWLADQTNDFVNVFRPRIRAAVADLLEEAR